MYTVGKLANPIPAIRVNVTLQRRYHYALDILPHNVMSLSMLDALHSINSSYTHSLQLPFRFRCSPNICSQPGSPSLFVQRINSHSVHFSNRIPTLFIVHELMCTCVITLDASLSRCPMFELVRETVIVHPFLHNLDVEANEDSRERLFDHRPEYRHGRADDGEIDLEAGEYDHGGRPPSEVDIGIRSGTCEVQHGLSHVCFLWDLRVATIP